MIRRLLALPLLVALLLALAPGVASAHVNIDPEEAVAGSTTTVTLSFHHGKDGTATTGLVVQLPEGTTVVEVPEVPGWTATVDEEAGTVTWSGGSVPDGDDGEFPLVVQLPATPGEVLFKTIQVTEAGELAWIEEEEGHEEGSYPSPRILLVADPDAPVSSDDATTTTDADDPGDETTTSRPAGTTLEAEQRDDGDGSIAGWLVGSALAAVAVIVAGGLFLRRRTG